MTSRPPRSRAEWASLAGSTAVVLLIVAQVPGDDLPAAPIARVERVHQVGEAFHVQVTVHNSGDATAANVQVMAELTAVDSAFSGDQTIDFLSGGEDQELTFVFGQDPMAGGLRVAVTGYAAP